MLCSLNLVAALLAPAAHATAPDAGPSVDDHQTAGVDIEIDPLAYALGGASLHGGLHVGRARFDLGVFSLKLPEWLHGNPGFVAHGHGFGLKADLFLNGAAQRARRGNAGLHLGGQLDITQQAITHAASAQSELYRELATGGRIGYRLQHRSGLYVDPWVGLVYRTNSPTEVELGGQTFRQSRITPFPTLHVGWRL